MKIDATVSNTQISRVIVVEGMWPFPYYFSYECI